MNRDFRDLLSAFNAAEVRYLVIGGYAVTFHSRPRYTKDIDLWIEATPQNAERAWHALAKFGAPLQDISAADLADPKCFVQIGVPPNRIDILSSVDGVDFASAWSRRVTAAYDDCQVAYIGLDDLIASKRAAGRPQDLIDADVLESARKSGAS